MMLWTDQETVLLQSTRPLRGATVRLRIRRSELDVSIHAPLAGRDHVAADQADPRGVSIHAPLAGRDE